MSILPFSDFIYDNGATINIRRKGAVAKPMLHIDTPKEFVIQLGKTDMSACQIGPTKLMIAVDNIMGIIGTLSTFSISILLRSNLHPINCL
ncbi:MAG: hypothetical protein ACUVTL_09425, partial [Thermoproteota archaeon]